MSRRRVFAVWVWFLILAGLLALIATDERPAPYDEYDPANATPFQGEMP